MTIVLATDSTGANAAAVRHAVALANGAADRLVSLHIGLPSPLLETEVANLASHARRPLDHVVQVVDEDDDVGELLIAAIRALRPTLVVVGTGARHGVAAVVRPSIAELLVRSLEVPVLVVPNHVAGFIGPDGVAAVRRVVIPSRKPVDARRAQGAACFVIGLLGDAQAELIETAAPLADVLDGIGRDADMISMCTHGHDGLADVLLGSATDRTIRAAMCPVLCVPP